MLQEKNMLNLVKICIPRNQKFDENTSLIINPENYSVGVMSGSASYTALSKRIKIIFVPLDVDTNLLFRELNDTQCQSLLKKICAQYTNDYTNHAYGSGHWKDIDCVERLSDILENIIQVRCCSRKNIVSL